MSNEAKRWLVKSAEFLHKNPWFSLQKQQVELPDGSEITYYSNHHERSGVGVVVRRNGNEYLLNKQYRLLINHFGWEIPAGGVDEGETAETAAKREVLEETGYKVSSLEHILTFYPTIGTSNERFECWLTEDPEKVTKDYDKNEIVENKWFSEDEILKMIHTNEINDGLSLVSLMKLLFNK